MNARYLILILLIAGSLSGKVFELLSVNNGEIKGTLNAMKGASYEVVEIEKAPWLQLSFSDKKYSLIYRYIKRSKIEAYFDGKPKDSKEYMNVTVKENVWTGYDEFKFDYFNPGKNEIALKLWILDFGSICSYLGFNAMMSGMLEAGTPDADPKYLQMGEIEVKLKPGKGTAVIKLSENILTADKRRVIDLSDIRAFAFRGTKKESVVCVNNIRLEGSSENAGVFPEIPPTIICDETKKGYHDAYASLCPFCGAKSHKIDGSNKEPKPGKGIKISAEYAGSYAPTNGGGGDNTELSGPPHIAHYDGSSWELRTLISFKTLGKLSSGAKIKKAELRMYGESVSKKPFVPVMKVYSVSEKYKIDLKKPLCWNTKPPVETLLFISGVYEGPEVPRWFTYDVTAYFKEKKRSYATFEIRSGISALTYDNPHPKGHCLMYGIPDPSKSPYLYIETE